MTYQNDPNRRGRTDGNRSYTGWIIGGVIALAVILGIFAMSNRNDSSSTASDTNRPATTAPATTGSGPATTTPAPATPAPAR